MQPINWYPGHIAKAQRELRERLSGVDAVLEMVDARLPLSSHFDFVDELLAHKERVVIINKLDLAPPETWQQARGLWKQKGFPVVAMDTIQRQGLNELKQVLQQFHKQLSEKLKKRGRLTRKLRLMVMGLPNVGKSSLINCLIAKRSLKVADKAGVTRHMQWVSLNHELELLDTPGVIPPKLTDPKLALKLALIGSVSDHAFESIRTAEMILDLWRTDYPGYVTLCYGRENMTVDDIGQMRQYLQQGGHIDTKRAAASLFHDFRTGKLPLLSLEVPLADPIEEPLDE